MTVKLDHYESCELADFILKTDNPEEDYDITEQALCDKWNIDVETFQEIAQGLFNMIDFALSPLTQEAFVGFSVGNSWVSRKKVNQQFISALINWCTEGEEIPENSRGFIRTITSNGKPEFEILIRKPKKE